MDLEIVGRHALLFDDDAAAEVVNSGGSLVPWSAAGATNLLLDRHDVRHLLDRVPPRPNRSYSVALLSAPSPDGVSETELDRERFLDLNAANEDGDGAGDDPSSGNGTYTGQTDYNAVFFSYGGPAGSDDPNDLVSYYRPSFPVPESLLNKLPPSEKVHQIIARTALFVSEHGGQSEIVLRVKQGSNPTFGFLMPDHHLHSYFRYIVDHPHLLKDGPYADTNRGNKTDMSESKHTASSSEALSLLGAVYESGDEDEDVLPASSKSIDPGNDVVLHEQGHKGAAFLTHDKEVKKDQTVTEEAATVVKDKPIFTKKNPTITGNSIVAAHREKVKGAMGVLTTSTKSETSKLGVSDTKEVILEPPSFLKGTMEKIVEFILRNGKEFEEKLIEQDRMTGRFPFLLPNNPYHSYYLKTLQETQELKSRGGSLEHKDSSKRRDRSSLERKDRRSSSERKDRSSSDRRDSGHEKEATKSKGRGSANKDSSASDRSSAEPSEKQLYDKQGKGKFQLVVDGVKKEPPRKVTADEAAAIVMAATRGLSPANPQSKMLKDTSDIYRIQDPGAASKPASNSEAGTSLTSSGQLNKEAIGVIDDDWIANTIAKAVAAAASKEADSSEASMTNEQKLKAERLRRARMFTAIIKGGGNKSDLVTTSDPMNESAKASPADLNLPGPDTEPLATEREGSSVPFEREGSNMTKLDKDSDDEQNKARKYRKHHPEPNEDEDDLEEESYTHSRKRHRSERSRGHSKDAHKHKHMQHSKDREYEHRRHSHSSSEDERRSSKSRHRDRHRDREYEHHDAEDDEHRSSHRHRRNHGAGSKRKHKDDRDPIEQTRSHVGAEASQSTPEHKYGSELPTSDAVQSSHATTEVPDELKAKIRAMLLETL